MFINFFCQFPYFHFPFPAAVAGEHVRGPRSAYASGPSEGLGKCCVIAKPQPMGVKSGLLLLCPGLQTLACLPHPMRSDFPSLESHRDPVRVAGPTLPSLKEPVFIWSRLADYNFQHPIPKKSFLCGTFSNLFRKEKCSPSIFTDQNLKGPLSRLIVLPYPDGKKLLSSQGDK